MLITHESSARISIWQDAAFAADGTRQASRQRSPEGNAQTRRPGVRLQANLIQLNAFVTDKRGRPVPNLRKADFLLLENGVPQNVKYFSVESFNASYEVSPAPERPSESPIPATPAARRSVMLLIDDLHISPENMIRVKQALRDFISFELRDDDEVALVTPSGRLGFLQQFTAERAALRLAVERLNGFSSPLRLSQDLLNLTPYQADLIARRETHALDAAVAELMAKSPGLLQGQTAREQLESRAISLAQRVLEMTEQRAISSIETLSNAISSLRRMDGAKLAIFVSEGIFMSTSLDQARSQLNTVIDAAIRASVVVYTVDARGLGGELSDLSVTTGDVTPGMRQLRQVSRAGERTALQDALRLIAKDTGGRALLNSNDLKAEFLEVMAENNFFYSLGYEPSVPMRGKPTFRRIQVKVRGRPDLSVRFQRGYLAVSTEAVATGQQQEDPEDRLRRALQAVTPYRDIGVAARANFLETAEEGAVIVVAIQIDVQSLHFTPVNGRQTTELELSGLIYTSHGKVAHSFSKRLSLNLQPKTYQEILHKGIQHIEHFRPAPGLYQMRVAVEEVSSGHLGSASQWVEVPDLGQNHLELSDIFFLTNVTTTPLAAEKDAPESITTGKLITPTARSFRATSMLDFGFYVYNAARAAGDRPPDLVVQIQVIRNNVPVLTNALQPIPVQVSPDPQRLFYGRRLPLASLSPGKYFLQITVIDRGSRQHATERIDFTII